MARLQVVCTEQIPVDRPTTHAHIIKIGTGLFTTPRKWTVDEVEAAIKRGEVFYTVSPSTRKEATVEVIYCPTCRIRKTLRSSADAVKDNNLDSLPRCR